MSFGSLHVHACGVDALETFFKLPDETFLEILSFFPAINFRYKFSGFRDVWGITFLPAEYAERVDALRTITQTCCTLRRKFLSWLWERVEACVPPKCAAWYTSLGNVLESKCHILLKNPSLAIHVRQAIVDVPPLPLSDAVSYTVLCLSPSHVIEWTSFSQLLQIASGPCQTYTLWNCATFTKK